MHIALVEDNQVLAKSIEQVLKHEGYSVSHFDNGATAHTALSHGAEAYDLIILDVLLPEMTGFEICKSLRKENVTTPVLMLTSKGALEDTVEGLDVGADDYLKKPFEFDELLARIRALLRRKSEILASQIAITPDVSVDTLARKVFKKGKEEHLTTKEFSLLMYFIHNPNKVLTQQELYDHVFDFAEVQMSNTIEVHIKNLRKKLRTSAFELPITTIRNAGYRFDYGN